MAKKKTLSDLLGIDGDRVKVDLDLAQDQYRGQVSSNIGNIQLPDIRAQKPTNTENLIKALGGLNKNLSTLVPALQAQGSAQLINLKGELEGMTDEQKREKLAELQESQNKKQKQINAEFRKDKSISDLNPFATIGAKKLVGASLSGDFIESLNTLPEELQKDMVTTNQGTVGTIPNQDTINNKIEEKLISFYTENDITDDLVKAGLRANASTSIDRISSALLTDMKTFHKEEIMIKGFAKSFSTMISDSVFDESNAAGFTNAIIGTFGDIDSLTPSEIEKAFVNGINLILPENAEKALANLRVLENIKIGTTKIKDMDTYVTAITKLQTLEERHEDLETQKKKDDILSIVSSEYALSQGDSEEIPLDQQYQNVLLGEISSEGEFVGNTFEALVNKKTEIDKLLSTMLMEGKLDKAQIFIAREENDKLYNNARIDVEADGVAMENMLGTDFDNFSENALVALDKELPSILKDAGIDTGNIVLESLIVDNEKDFSGKSIINPNIAEELEDLNIDFRLAFTSITQQAGRLQGSVQDKVTFAKNKLNELTERYKEAVKTTVVQKNFPSVKTTLLADIKDNPVYTVQGITADILGKDSDFILDSGVSILSNLDIFNEHNIADMFINSESFTRISDDLTTYFDFLAIQDKDTDFLSSNIHTQVSKKIQNENLSARQLLAKSMQFSNNTDLSNESKKDYYERSNRVQNLLTLTGINFGDVVRIGQNGSEGEYYLPTNEYLNENFVADIVNGNIPIFNMFEGDEINLYLDKDKIEYNDLSDKIKQVMDTYNIRRSLAEPFVRLQAQKVSQFSMVGINRSHRMYKQLVIPLSQEEIDIKKAEAINRDVGGDSIDTSGYFDATPFIKFGQKVGRFGQKVGRVFTDTKAVIDEAKGDSFINLPEDFKYNRSLTNIGINTNENPKITAKTETNTNKTDVITKEESQPTVTPKATPTRDEIIKLYKDSFGSNLPKSVLERMTDNADLLKYVESRIKDPQFPTINEEQEL